MPVFVRFTTPAPGSSSAQTVRYITRESAVREGRDGILLVNLPAEVSAAKQYDALRASLIAWAAVREVHERERAGRQATRTHYRAILGFDREVTARNALQLAKTWLATVLPSARALAALHQDTGRPHVHVWMEARQTDGRKVNLSAREFRQLDEAWNRIYCRAFGLCEREHLAKKRETERHKQLQWGERPGRIAHSWNPKLYTLREFERLGINLNERVKIRVNTDKRAATAEDSFAASREQDFAGRERAVERSAQSIDATERGIARAVSEARKLHAAASRLAEREREMSPEWEKERER